MGMAPENEIALVNALERISEHLNNATESLERIAKILEKWDRHYVPIAKVP